MADGVDETVVLQGLLDRIRAGDVAARALLVDRACERLRRLARRALKSFPLVGRWDQTDDVLQGAMIRLMRALEKVTPGTVREFLALCSTHMRRELIDLKRHHYGPEGAGAHHASQIKPNANDSQSPGPIEPGGLTLDPSSLAMWTEFHRQVESLPADQREVFDLIWYQELTQEQAAQLLEVSAKTVNRRWREARIELGKFLGGNSVP